MTEFDQRTYVFTKTMFGILAANVATKVTHVVFHNRFSPIFIHVYGGVVVQDNSGPWQYVVKSLGVVCKILFRQ